MNKRILASVHFFFRGASMQETSASKSPLILVVDDEDRNIQYMKAVLESCNYETIAATSGHSALEIAKSYKIDLIILDVMMPNMDGFEVCQSLKSNEATANIPIILSTALSDRESKIKGLESGANDFLTKPIDRSEITLRVKNLLKIKSYEDKLRSYNTDLEAEVKLRTGQLRQALTTLKQANKDIQSSHDLLEQSLLDTVNRLTNAAECKDEDTSEHIRRVSSYAVMFAKKLRWSGNSLKDIMYASVLHDIGKISIPSEILLKPGKLFKEEFSLMQTHAIAGARILSGASSSCLQMAERIARGHHERFDGTGYPDRLSGSDIPIEAQIVSLADVYDALRSRRPYKPAFTHETAARIILEGDNITSPGHFSPMLLEIFKTIHNEFESIFAHAPDAYSI